MKTKNETFEPRRQHFKKGNDVERNKTVEKKYLSGSGEAISTFSNGDVEDELLDLDVSHWV